MAQIRAMHERLPASPGGRITSFLPSAHIADRWSHHYQCSIGLGFTVTCIADPQTVVAHLPAIKPTAWGSVPRVWEKMRAALEAQGVTNPASLPEEQRAAIRAKLGLDQAEWLVVGGAPSPPDLLRYFADLGLELCELFGMSETSCTITCNPPGRVKIGTCGPAIDGVELALAEDGELLVRGAMVMSGYRGDAAADCGGDRRGRVAAHRRHRADRRRRVRHGRRPQEGVDHQRRRQEHEPGEHRGGAQERAPADRPSGRGRRPAPLQRRANRPRPRRRRRVRAGARHSATPRRAHSRSTSASRQTVAGAVADANTKLARIEQIKRHTILPCDWAPGGEELTPTMKLRRKPIAEKYAPEIDALYA